MKHDWFKAILTLWIIVFTIAVGFGWHANRVQARKGAVALAALCTLRDDLARRASSAEQFLRDHPQGIPGIPASTIRTSVLNQRVTLRSLENLDCVRKEHP